MKSFNTLRFWWFKVKITGLMFSENLNETQLLFIKLGYLLDSKKLDYCLVKYFVGPNAFKLAYDPEFKRNIYGEIPLNEFTLFQISGFIIPTTGLFEDLKNFTGLRAYWNKKGLSKYGKEILKGLVKKYK